MAKKIKNVDDWLIDVQNKGLFVGADGNFDTNAALAHFDKVMSEIEGNMRAWDSLKDKIQSYYGELDKLSNKKFNTFNVKTFKGDLDKMETDYNHFQRDLEREAQKMYAKWGKASKQEIHDNFNEWTRDNNKLLRMQEQSLAKTKEMAAKAMEDFRNGMNIFDRMNPHIEAFFKGMVKGVNEVKSGFNKSKEALFSWTEPWAKANQAAANYAKNVGLGVAGMKNLLSESIRFANQAQIGIKYNKSIEEMIKLQQEYTSTIGRNVSLTDSYKESLAAMSAVMGDQRTIDITGKLENFGINPEETGRRIGKMFDDSAKKGIAFSKYSETFANNIKLAQNYTFENGVRGVASMAEKATKLRLEMQSVANLANKVNNVQGAVEVGAKLQVLGGTFSQFADPLGMLYEGTSDLEGLQDRIVNLVGNLGSFNKKTGEVEVSAFDRMRVNAAAEAMGINNTELMEMIHAKGRRNEIANQMRGLGYDSQLQELIMNTGSFDENGNAGVSINGKFVGVGELGGRRDELIALNQSETDDIKEIATLLRGWDDTMQGFKKQREAKQASWVQKSGIGALTMTAVQYLGQANWALNIIVGLLTTGKAISFGQGMWGMAGGATRTAAGAFQNVRMNNMMKRNNLSGKDLKVTQRHRKQNSGVLISPDGSGNRSAGVGGTDFRSLQVDRYRGLGSGLGVNTGVVPINPGRANNNYIPPISSAGVPSVSPVATGSYGVPSMGPVATGSYGVPSMGPVAMGAYGVPSMAPVAMGNTVAYGADSGAYASAMRAPSNGAVFTGMGAPSFKLANGKTIDTNSFVLDEKTGKYVNPKTGEILTQQKNGQFWHTDDKGNRTHLGTVGRDGEFVQSKNVQAVGNSKSGPSNFAFDTDGNGKFNSNRKITLNDGRTINTKDFTMNEKGQMVNSKTGQKIIMDKNGGEWLYDGNKRQKLGTHGADGSYTGSKNIKNVKNTGSAGKGWFKQAGGSFLKTAGNVGAVAGAMLLGPGLNMWGNSIQNKNAEAIAEGKYKENSNEDWKKRNQSAFLSGAGTGASMGAMIGMMIPGVGPVASLIGAGIGALVGGTIGLVKSKKEQKKTQQKINLMEKIARYRGGRGLQGEYSNEQLSRIASYVETNNPSTMMSSDWDALKKNGSDYNIIAGTRRKYKYGGWHTGPSHEQGGIPVEMEGGEYSLNKAAAQKISSNHPGALERMNATGTLIKSRESIKPLKVSESLKNGNSGVGVGVGEIGIKPIDINVNGTIKLDVGKGKNIDIAGMIANNPQLLRSITDMIEKQININVNGAFNKEKSLNKW